MQIAAKLAPMQPAGKAKLPENKGKKLIFYCKGPK